MLLMTTENVFKIEEWGDSDVAEVEFEGELINAVEGLEK